MENRYPTVWTCRLKAKAIPILLFRRKNTKNTKTLNTTRENYIYLNYSQTYPLLSSRSRAERISSVGRWVSVSLPLTNRCGCLPAADPGSVAPRRQVREGEGDDAGSYRSFPSPPLLSLLRQRPVSGKRAELNPLLLALLTVFTVRGHGECGRTGGGMPTRESSNSRSWETYCDKSLCVCLWPPARLALLPSYKNTHKKARVRANDVFIEFISVVYLQTSAFTPKTVTMPLWKPVSAT